MGKLAMTVVGALVVGVVGGLSVLGGVLVLPIVWALRLAARLYVFMLRRCCHVVKIKPDRTTALGYGDFVLDLRRYEIARDFLPEVSEWCRANLQGSYGIVPRPNHEVGQHPDAMWFTKRNDAFAFKMRWG